jgi:hypothetical protein
LSPDLAAALRSETPTAPDRLRVRVAQIAAAPPPPPRRVLPLRRLLPIGIAAVVAASGATAAVIGLVSSSRPPVTDFAGRETAPPTRSLVPSQTLEGARARAADAAPIPSSGRAQDYEASLTVLVDGTEDLSTTTQRVLRTTRRLGGYLVTVQYGTPEPTEGTASIRVKIPISRVQAAIVQFSDLGRILSQEVHIADLQQTLDELTRRIRRLERSGGSQAEIAVLRRQRAELNRRAAYATVSLDLTTHEPRRETAPPGRLERAIDDATGVLAAELAIAAYALIVAAPFLVLLGAVWAGNRAYRRQADQRLLERA